MLYHTKLKLHGNVMNVDLNGIQQLMIKSFAKIEQVAQNVEERLLLLKDINEQ